MVTSFFYLSTPKKIQYCETICLLVSHLPLMKIRKKHIPLVSAKLPPASSAFSSTPTDRLYWLDPVHLIATLLASSEFKTNMHIGMAEFVDSPKELWHSQSWWASIRACSGIFAYCGSH